MTYIVWYNTKYKRQFEAVVPRDEWNKMKATYGVAGAAALLVAGTHRVKSRKRATTKRRASATSFIIGSITRPDIYGSPIIKVGATKKQILDRGRSELIVTSTRKRVNVYPMERSRQGTRKRRGRHG